MSYYLSAKDALIGARKAFNNGTLQIQTSQGSGEVACFYSAPCAIGAAMPTELRSGFDIPIHTDMGNTSTSIGGLVDSGDIETDNLETLIRLQTAHDSFNLVLFEDTLIKLETQHGLRTVA